MFKALLVSLNLIGIIILKFMFGGDVQVSQKFPEQVQPGESFVLEVTIEKGDQEGFAKWQQKLPKGFIASPVETAGATFSFKNQDVKLIWMALPKSESILVSYEVSLDPSIIGEFELEGKFSFIEENERKDIGSGKKVISIGAVSTELAEETSENSEDLSSEEIDPVVMPDSITEVPANEIAEQIEIPEEIKEDSPVEELETAVVEDSKTEDAEETEELISSPAEEYVLDQQGIKVKRLLEHLGDGIYGVNLQIEKGSSTSFGKIEEFLPEDFTAEIIEADGGIVSFKNRVIKVLWMTLPEKSSLEISYMMKSSTDLFDSTEVHGVFSFLDNNETAQLELEATHFKNYYVEPVETAEELAEADSSSKPSEEATETSMVETSETADNSSPESTESESDQQANSNIEANSDAASISNIPAPESNINYKVQLAAGKKEVEKDYFKKRYQITDPIAIEYHETWYKYTIGNHDVYKSARDHRNEMWNREKPIKDAFVTAYNAGERITVQEALMISNQKWFK